MKTIFSVVALVLSLNAFSQQKISYTSKLPAGYKLVDVNNEKGASIESDFDKDGMMDLAIILSAKDDNNAILAIFLSSHFKKDKSYQKCNWFHMTNDFEVKKNVITLSGMDMGKYLSEIKLKYDPTIKKMKITSSIESNLKGDSKAPKPKLVNASLL